MNNSGTYRSTNLGIKPRFVPVATGVRLACSIVYRQETRDSTLSYMVKTRSLYLTSSWIGTGSWQTDGRTDQQTELQ